jgi:drug/metabolite transporter (DMT)-like permease
VTHSLNNRQSLLKNWLFVSLALLAFAGNSVLCRLALGAETIDAASFTSIRLIAGIVMLTIILLVKHTYTKKTTASTGSWGAAFMLFTYALTFSYAYLSLETGIGALILFSSVQLTMVIYSILKGQRLNRFEWLGLIIAFSGFVYLMSPTLSTPSFIGFILMTISGISWGFYTLMGKTSKQPLQDTAYNFIRTAPWIILLLTLTIQTNELSYNGMLLAIISGAITSGIGYALWYVALSGISSIQAAVLQLLVPVIATIGGIIFVDESMSLHLIVSTAVILVGILFVMLNKKTTI